VLAGLSRRDDNMRPDDLVFSPGYNVPFHHDTVRKRFYAALDAAGLGRLRTKEDPIVFRDLRHTFGTLAVQAFPLSDVKAMMGHADISTTMIYVHHVSQTDAAARLSALLDIDKTRLDAERIATATRSAMGLGDTDMLDAFELAAHVGADVRSADELVSRKKLEALDRLQPGAFSACTFTIGENNVIVYNPLCTPGRTQSDLAHEVAHILLDHDVQEVQQLGDLTFYSCDPDEEQEANWLAGCLLLPRTLLLRAARRGLDGPTIAEKFTVSERMANYRLRATGVLLQIQRGGKQR